MVLIIRRPCTCWLVVQSLMVYAQSIKRYKARLDVLGNCQEYGLNYNETFAPVVKMTTVNTIIAIAASKE